MALRPSPPSAQPRLTVALTIAGALTAFEIVGGFLSNSLALLSDAGHVFTDALGIGLGLLAVRMALRPHTPTLTYGYHRAEILAAFGNGALLIGISLLIFYEAYRRFSEPPEVKGPLLLTFASIGLLANLAMVLILRQEASQSLNVKAAFLHVMTDTLSSLGVIGGAVIILVSNLTSIDAVIGGLIGILILRSAVTLVKDAVNVLFEATPAHIDLGQLARAVKDIEGVRDIHDLHVWTITSGFYALSGHLVVEDQSISEASNIVKRAEKLLKDKFHVTHITLQLESAPEVKFREPKP